MPDLTAAEPAIDVRDLCVDRGGSPILKDLRLSVNAGEVYALLGGNGAGKSTTLAVLMGLLRPASGSVRVMGLDPATQAVAALTAISQGRESQEIRSRFQALSGARPSRAEMDAALDAAGLQAGARTRRTDGFSKGMRQKVAIAMALLREVPVLLLDEPTTGLDPVATADFNRLVGGLRARGAAILMVTHDLLGAADCADRIGVLAGGGIVEEAPAREGLDVLALHRRFGEAAAG